MIKSVLALIFIVLGIFCLFAAAFGVPTIPEILGMHKRKKNNINFLDWKEDDRVYLSSNKGNFINFLALYKGILDDGRVCFEDYINENYFTRTKEELENDPELINETLSSRSLKLKNNKLKTQLKNSRTNEKIKIAQSELNKLKKDDKA